MLSPITIAFFIRVISFLFFRYLYASLRLDGDIKERFTWTRFLPRRFRLPANFTPNRAKWHPYAPVNIPA
ncbi:MAG: hypothetical protein HW419_1182 [Deltaproteobacteria bacterium]|nr:hypothetical protein [Deltaproteobacteria bacterium]